MLKENTITHLFDTDLFNEEEARIFILFLESEMKRHLQDILDITKKIQYLKIRYIKKEKME